MKRSTAKSGKLGEDIAAHYLERQGYTILERNWRGGDKIKCPEIDLIARKSDAIVFIEVKTASTSMFGPPETWITERKRRRLAEAGQVYQAIHADERCSFRFDAIAVDARGIRPKIKHIKNAFLLSDFEEE